MLSIYTSLSCLKSFYVHFISLFVGTETLKVCIFFLQNSVGVTFQFSDIIIIIIEKQPALGEVGVGAPLRPNVSKGSISTTLVGGLLLGDPPGAESFLILLGLLIILIHTFIELFMSF